jgi:hypothetical protein
MSMDSISFRPSASAAMPKADSDDLLAFKLPAPAIQAPATPPKPSGPGNVPSAPLTGQGNRAQEQIFLRTEFLMFGSLGDAVGQAARMTAFGDPLGLPYQQGLSNVLTERSERLDHARGNFTPEEQQELARAVAETLGSLISERINPNSDAFKAAILSTFDLAFNLIRQRRGELPRQEQQESEPAPIQGPPAPIQGRPAPTFEPPTGIETPQRQEPPQRMERTETPTEAEETTEASGLTPEQMGERIADFLPRAGNDLPVVYGTNGAEAAKSAAIAYNGRSDTFVAVPLEVEARIGEQVARTWVLYTGVDPSSAADLPGNVDATGSFSVINLATALRDGGLSLEGLIARAQRLMERAFPSTLPTIGGRQMTAINSEAEYESARNSARTNNESRISSGDLDSLDLVVPMQNGVGAAIQDITRGQLVSLLNSIQSNLQLRIGVTLNDVIAAMGLGSIIGTDGDNRVTLRTPTSETEQTDEPDEPDPWRTPPAEPPEEPDEPPPITFQPALPPASPIGQLMLPPAGGTSSPDNDTGTDGADGGDGGNGGSGGVTGAGGIDPEEPDPDAGLNKFQKWMKASINNWKSLKGNAAQRSQQFRESIGRTIKTVGTAYGITQAMGAAGGAIFYGGIREERTSHPVTAENAKEELAKLQADPLQYLQSNYTNAFAGINVGDRLYNMSGNLLEMDNPDGSLYHFRRVPEDMFNALRDAQIEQGIDVSEGVFVTEEFERDGETETLTVEIRPPFRAEPLRDAQLLISQAEGSRPTSFGFRANMRFGPPEGQNFNLDAEAFFNYRHQTGTVSTIRMGLPSPTNPDAGIGVRQQDTTPWSSLGIGATAMDFNPYQVRDLTDPDSPFNDGRLTLANGRMYVNIGNRNRVRLDAVGSGADINQLSDGYGRARATGYVEVGLGGDFLRFTRGDDWVSANFYNEMQFYTPDLRLQLGGGGASGGFKPIPPLFELDPAIQFSTNTGNRITPALPFLTTDPLQMEEVMRLVPDTERLERMRNRVVDFFTPPPPPPQDEVEQPVAEPEPAPIPVPQDEVEQPVAEPDPAPSPVPPPPRGPHELEITP